MIGSTEKCISQQKKVERYYDVDIGLWLPKNINYESKKHT